MNVLTETAEKTVADWRREIDVIDGQVLLLLNLRASIACKLAATKAASGLPAYDGQRERQVLARIEAMNAGPLESASILDIFRRIIRETRRIGTKAMRQYQNSPETTEQQVTEITQEHCNGDQHGSRRV